MDFKDLKGTYIIEIAEMEPLSSVEEQEKVKASIENLKDVAFFEAIDPEEEEQ